MICHEFKGGIGTSSRVGTAAGVPFTVGVLVQANYGERSDLRVDGVPVGREIGVDVVPSPWDDPPDGGSIIIVIATDAPLLPIQCRRLAQRATVGLARVGGYGHESSGDIFLAFSTQSLHDGGSIIIVIATDAPLLPIQCRRLAQRATVGLPRVGGYGHESSGDIFLAFSTANHLGGDRESPLEVRTLPLESMDPVFHAAADATEEAIVNALCAAQTMTGRAGHTAPALPLDPLSKCALCPSSRWIPFSTRQPMQPRRRSSMRSAPPRP